MNHKMHPAVRELHQRYGRLLPRMIIRHLVFQDCDLSLRNYIRKYLKDASPVRLANNNAAYWLCDAASAEVLGKAKKKKLPPKGQNLYELLAVQAFCTLDKTERLLITGGELKGRFSMLDSPSVRKNFYFFVEDEVGRSGIGHVIADTGQQYDTIVRTTKENISKRRRIPAPHALQDLILSGRLSMWVVTFSKERANDLRLAFKSDDSPLFGIVPWHVYHSVPYEKLIPSVEKE